MAQSANAHTLAAIDQLKSTLRGEVRDDRLARALYSTDASIYEIVPDAVVYPVSVEDVQNAVRICGEHRVPITPRGAGTGLAGGAVNRGVQLDCSRHLNRILNIDPARRTAVVEPGVVLDELNAALRPHGLQFAPDVATSSRATIGGMIANNSCGAHSVMYGRTVDHVRGVDVVLADGSRHRWGSFDNAADAPHNELAAQCEAALFRVCENDRDEIAARFPKVMRRNGGYALDRLSTATGRINPETIICGSEGTLAIVVGAVLNLVPLARHRGIVVAHFADLLDALAATPAALQHNPAAVELLDKLILDAARENPVMRRRPWLIEGDPHGILVIELYDDDAERLTSRLHVLAGDFKSRGLGYAWPVLADTALQDEVWYVRKSGLGLLMSKPGDRQTYDFVEDTAVDPTKLRDYIARFMTVLSEEGVTEASYYAHASVGCLHVKPVLNLKSAGDISRMHRIADRISSLALEFGGTMTGEHGDGILRSCWLEKMYGPRIVGAFRAIKAAFDPHNILNPGKIVDPLPMLDNFRYGPAYQAENPLTVLDFSAHGGMAGLAEMCSGVGQCRQKLVGVMCPSYMATGDEQHTTRARANALRLALSNRDILDGLADPALDEVMDLCLSCKACKTECPTGVDMARLKSEWQHHRHQRSGAPLGSRLVARAADLAAWGYRFAAVANRLGQSRTVRGVIEAATGFDARICPPRFARESFRDWFARHSHRRTQRPGARRVAYFVDTWTNYFMPKVGIAAVRILEHLGCEVVVPPTVCCGRPAISKGMLLHAKKLAERNVAVLSPIVEQGIPIIGTEPSCILTFMDEVPQLVRGSMADRLGAGAMMLETFLAREFAHRLKGLGSNIPVLYHGHCHQKALVGTGDAVGILKSVCGGGATELNTGCCGMAGSFGHERDHYDVSRAVGEQRLFPAVRDRGIAEIAVSGFSCREQISHHTGAKARHIIEIIADRMLIE
jgi:FAD/FMN-containing dehydrogenase/Fe-S oxidoreductase